ncbi:MAG: beta-propeller domain-containing protein [Planctomycetes bacterium]|nr:beta-propeller domain-containing protein [Planctomycetota bacterium]
MNTKIIIAALSVLIPIAVSCDPEGVARFPGQNQNPLPDYDDNRSDNLPPVVDVDQHTGEPIYDASLVNGSMLRRIESKSELTARLSSSQTTNYNREYDTAAMAGAAPPTAQSAAPAGGGSNTSGTTSSTTTIQEEGVDESDLVKNDTRYIYVADGHKLRVIDSYPATAMREAATMEFAGYIRGIYLQKAAARLVVVSEVYANYYDIYSSSNTAMPMLAGAPAPEYMNTSASVAITTVNVASPDFPAETETRFFEGSYVSSRLIEDKLTLVVNSWNYGYYYDALPGRGFEAMGATSVAYYPDYGSPSLDVDDFIPETWMGGSNDRDPLYEATDIHVQTEPYASLELTSVVSIDVNDLESGYKAIGVNDTFGVTYVSLEALYVTKQDYVYRPSHTEYRTLIHRIDFTVDGPVYTGSGVVEGSTWDSYSFSEYEGHLRVATHVDAWNSPNGVSYNLVTVLKNKDAKLTRVGVIDNIAPGEDLYSVRFAGKYGFVITFQRIDPLFTLDLSDPENPIIRGELEVPGYSEFMIPISANHIISVGRGVQLQNGFPRPYGVQINLFDISDLDSPQLLRQVDLTDIPTPNDNQWSTSPALYDPKAFQWYPEQSLLAVPVEVYNYSNDYSYSMSAERNVHVYAVNQTAGDFEFVRKFGFTPDSSVTNYYYDPFVRTVFIDRTAYAVTENLLRGIDLDSGSQASPTDLSLNSGN